MCVVQMAIDPADSQAISLRDTLCCERVRCFRNRCSICDVPDSTCTFIYCCSYGKILLRRRNQLWLKSIISESRCVKVVFHVSTDGDRFFTQLSGIFIHIFQFPPPPGGSRRHDYGIIVDFFNPIRNPPKTLFVWSYKYNCTVPFLWL